MPQIVPLEAPAGTDPSWALRGWADVDRADQLDSLGYDDLAGSVHARLVRLGDTKHVDRRVLLAVADDVPIPDGTAPSTGASPGEPGSVLGYAHLDLPLSDNTHLVLVELVVRPTARRHGVGTALWAAADRLVADSRRTVVTTWTGHPGEPPADAGTLTAATGVGRIPRDSAPARFALARGFTLEQTERHSVLDVDPPRYVGLEADAAARAGADYRLVQWTGPTPQPRLTDIAELLRRMSVDAPMGGLAFEEEAWDAERVRDEDARVAQGYTAVVTAAEHVPTGALVAYTQINVPRDRPAVGWQENTIVHGEHRGHRLGMLVKTANLRHLHAHHPAVVRVHTWNAGENRHMLAINEALGFRLASVVGAWQQRRTSA